MNKTTIYTKVVNGRIHSNRKSIAKVIREYEGKNIEITIQKRRKRRSNNQNAYYWGVIVELIKSAILDSWGETMSSDEVHNILKSQLNYKEQINQKTGEVIKTPKSTTQLSTIECEQFYHECRTWAKEWFGIEIPMPNEQLTFN